MYCFVIVVSTHVIIVLHESYVSKWNNKFINKCRFLNTTFCSNWLAAKYVSFIITLILFLKFIFFPFSCYNGTPPVECLKGTYSNAGEEGCTACPKGFYCPQNALKGPLPCQLGEHADTTGRTNCTICPAGYFCNDTSTLPAPCHDGFYSPAKMSACSPCPGGYG